MLSLMIGAPVMLTAVVIGLLISIAQAVTQLQDQTLSFVPKIVAMVVVLILILPWALEQTAEYATDLFQAVPQLLIHDSL
jgi:flagellar biosynthetic protein FliQ